MSGDESYISNDSRYKRALAALGDLCDLLIRAVAIALERRSLMAAT